jgi:hypothetical protein
MLRIEVYRTQDRSLSIVVCLPAIAHYDSSPRRELPWFDISSLMKQSTRAAR